MDIERRVRRWDVVRDTWRTRLWPLPAMGIVVAIGLGVGLPRLDARIDHRLPAEVTRYLFTGGPEAARTVLSVIAGSLVTVTSLIFSLTVLTLQLASSQYSPRLLRTFTRDRFVHVTLAVLLATFMYSVTVLRTIRASVIEHSAFVPQLSVTVAFASQVAAVMMLVLFLAHLAGQIRVESLLRSVHSEASETIRRVLDDKRMPADPAVWRVPETSTTALCARSSGFLIAVEDELLLAAAVEADAMVFMDRVPGDSIIVGTPIAAAWATDGGGPLRDDAAALLEERVNAAVRTGFERTPARDFVFGLRQLVDVAIKALSPGINDPTTAVHALSHASAVLCELAGRNLGSCLLQDGDGRDRVLVRRPDMPTLLELVVAQPRRYGAGEPEVLARLFALLRELAWVTSRPGDRQAVKDQLVRLRAAVRRQDYDDAERAGLESAAHTVEKALRGHWPPARPG
ncbi:DUF2254 domain-containing protein [Microbispora bryophytorum]|uniref:DUF2254 domain-containing protein n=1 Tax=Microbispora bryophytorum subsp. camponoti TaxID=1677852 RepID=A0ABR8L6D2_9ACTN|nr:DUF2254 domain-containing protein [Microbispora camponoti]MBD3145811.1 DUF2254 domain-containing protein [Microbispora camponoti]